MNVINFLLILIAVFFLTGCAGTPRYTHSLDRESDKEVVRTCSFKETGMASYYANKFNGRKTASGERYNMNDLTAAHPRLPFGTRVKVTNLSNGLSVVVRVNDRGPFKKGRCIDLSLAAAKRIGLIARGSEKVRIEGVK